MGLKRVLAVLLTVCCGSSALCGEMWQAVKNPEKFIFRKGDTSKITLSDAVAGKILVVEGRDGALAVVYNAHGEMNLKNILLRKGTETTFTIRRFEQKGFKSAGSVRFLCKDNANANFGFCVSPQRYYIHSHFDRFRQLTGRPADAKPWQFHFVRTVADEYLCTNLKQHFKEIKVPAKKEFSTLALRFDHWQKQQVGLLELEPVKSSVIARSPAKPDIRSIPKGIYANAMLCFIPGYIPHYRHKYYGNAPLIPDAPGKFPRNNFGTVSAQVQFFKDMKAAGVDAVIFCIFDNFGTFHLWNNCEAARLSGTGIKVGIFFDNIKKEHTTYLRDAWYDKSVLNHPNFLKAGDCPLVFISAARGVSGKSGREKEWKEAIETYRRVGAEYVLLTGIQARGMMTELDFFRPAARPLCAVTDGMYFFNSHSTVWRGRRGSGICPALLDFKKSFKEPKYLGAGVAPGYVGVGRCGTLLSQRGTLALRYAWLDVINTGNFDFIHLTTMNDYTETEMEVTCNSTFSFIDLNYYFGTRWKTGKFPVDRKHMAFLSYRKILNSREALEAELVLLTPDIKKADVSRYSASCFIRVNDGEKIALPKVDPEFLPGHLVWNFKGKALENLSGTAEFYVQIKLDGKRIALPAGRTAPFLLVSDGESLSRKYLHVPLHRLRNETAEVVVEPSPAGDMPRRIRLVNTRNNAHITGGIIERAGHPFRSSMPFAMLKNGILDDMMSDQSSFSVYRVNNYYIKRCYADKLDRYTAVIRYKDNTIGFARPKTVSAPRPDSAAVMDLMISPELYTADKKNYYLLDQSPLRAHWKWPVKAEEKPQILSDTPGSWHYLRFNGKSSRLVRGCLNAPPGPATLEMLIRPHDTGRPQTIMDMWGASFSIGLQKDGRLSLLRENRERSGVWLSGKTKLKANSFCHIAAVFDGSNLKLYLNGKFEAGVPCTGLRSEEKVSIGVNCGVIEPYTGRKGEWSRAYKGDIAMFRLLERVMPPEEIQQRAVQSLQRMNKK